jgi:hypothetical protein
MLDRRTAIKQFVFASAGIALLPSCMQDTGKASILLKNINISGEQEKMLAELCESIIPKTDTPGAKDISAHLFALKMADDCAKKEDQQKFMKGLKAFEQTTKDTFKKSFPECTPQQRQQLLSKLESSKDPNDDVTMFYGAMKSLTIEAYTTSQFYLTKVHVYKLVPGTFKGCVPISAKTF